MPGIAHSSPAVRIAPLVVKVGGRALDAPGAEAELAAALAALGRPALIVHGGGREVSDWCVRLGHAPRFDRGLRVTDAATLEVAAAVLGGLANARLVARLRAAGVDAVGLNALDGGLIDAELHAASAQLGRVGRVCSVRTGLLGLLLGSGAVPVVSSIGAQDGELLNLNADEIAGALASALCASALVLMSDVDGVRIDGAVVPVIHADEIAGLTRRDDVRDGMIPKLEAARQALAGGVSRVHIASWRGPSTLQALADGSLPATVVLPTRKESAHA